MKPAAHTLARRWTIVVGAVLVATAWLVTSGGAAASAAVGAVLVVLFLSSGLVALRLFGRPDVPGGMGIVVFLLSYALRLAVLLFAAALIIRFDWVDGTWLGTSIVACAIMWVTAHVWHSWRRSKTELTIEPETTTDPAPNGASDAGRGS